MIREYVSNSIERSTKVPESIIYAFSKKLYIVQAPGHLLNSI